MSKSLNQERRSWKDLESSVRGKVAYRSGLPLSKRDGATYVATIELLTLLLRDLLSSRSPSRTSRIIRLRKAFFNYDVLEVSNLFKELVTYIRHYEMSDTVSYASFKQTYRDRYSFIGDILSPVKEEMEEFLSSPSPATFTVLNQYFSFYSKLSLKDVDLDDDAIQRYKATEERLRHCTYRQSTLHGLNVIMNEWMRTFSCDDLLPSHGNGSVFESRNRKEASLGFKYHSLGKDIRLEYFLRPLGGIETFCPRPLPNAAIRTCQVQCVPKSISSKRVISMEPAVLQYFQHGLYREIDCHIRHNPVLRKRIYIHDATINCHQACKGSITRKYATIDLSDASDSVSLELVKAIFAHTPIYRALVCTRSDKALLPDGSVLDMRKFAPMGSAVCFPIECLVFACICEYALRISGIHYSREILPYVVHGDDIVVRTEIAPLVCEILEECNFVLNLDKTFVSEDLSFRESCGCEYFQGVDVTPFRLSRKFCGNLPSMAVPEMYPHYIKMANLLFLYRFRLTRLWFVHNLLLLPKNLRPLFGPNESLVNSVSYSNYHLNRKVKRKWQCEILECGSLKIEHLPDRIEDEDIRLFEWLRVTSTRRCGPSDPDDLLDVHLSRPTLKLKSRFVSNS